jgi:hypothetical protein
MLPRLTFAAAATLAACSSATAPAAADDVAAALTLDRARYVAARVSPAGTLPQYAVTVVARLRNGSTEPLRLEACGAAPGPIHGVEQVRPAHPDGSAFSPVWGCPAGPPLVLAPGAERVDTLVLRGPTGVQGGRVLGALQGTVRLTYPATQCPAAGPCEGGAARAVRLRSGEVAISLP